MGEVGSCPSRDQRAGSIGPSKLRAGPMWQSKTTKTRREVQEQLKTCPERAEAAVIPHQSVRPSRLYCMTSMFVGVGARVTKEPCLQPTVSHRRTVQLFLLNYIHTVPRDRRSLVD